MSLMEPTLFDRIKRKALDNPVVVGALLIIIALVYVPKIISGLKALDEIAKAEGFAASSQMLTVGPNTTNKETLSGERSTGLLEIAQPFFIICESAYKEETQAKQRIVELKGLGLFPVGYLWIPDYKSLSSTKLFQVYHGPFRTEKEAETALCKYEKKFHVKTYGVRVSSQLDRKEVRCRF